MAIDGNKWEKSHYWNVVILININEKSLSVDDLILFGRGFEIFFSRFVFISIFSQFRKISVQIELTFRFSFAIRDSNTCEFELCDRFVGTVCSQYPINVVATVGTHIPNEISVEIVLLDWLWLLLRIVACTSNWILIKHWLIYNCFDYYYYFYNITYTM